MMGLDDTTSKVYYGSVNGFGDDDDDTDSDDPDISF